MEEPTDERFSKWKVKESSMNVSALNNLVVSMRPTFKKAKVFAIKGITRQMQKYKSRKGPEKQIATYQKKVKKIQEEIASIKSLKPDDAIKFAYANELPFDKLASQGDMAKRAMGRIAMQLSLQTEVKKWRSKHEDWRALAAFMLSKNTGRRFKKKKETTPVEVANTMTTKIKPKETAQRRQKAEDSLKIRCAKSDKTGTTVSDRDTKSNFKSKSKQTSQVKETNLDSDSDSHDEIANEKEKTHSDTTSDSDDEDISENRNEESKLHSNSEADSDDEVAENSNEEGKKHSNSEADSDDEVGENSNEEEKKHSNSEADSDDEVGENSNEEEKMHSNSEADSDDEVAENSSEEGKTYSDSDVAEDSEEESEKVLNSDVEDDLQSEGEEMKRKIEPVQIEKKTITSTSKEMVVKKLNIADLSGDGDLIIETVPRNKSIDFLFQSNAPGKKRKRKDVFFLDSDNENNSEEDVDSDNEAIEGTDSGQEDEGFFSKKTDFPMKRMSESSFVGTLSKDSRQPRGFDDRRNREDTRLQPDSRKQSKPFERPRENNKAQNVNNVQKREYTSGNKTDNRKTKTSDSTEKLHPSWEASKKRKLEASRIVAFQGKKITFDDD